MTNLLNKAKFNKIRNDDTFHLAVAPVISIAQIFGLFPINEVFSRNIQDIKFKLFSFRTLHSGAWLVSSFIFVLLEIFKTFKEGSISALTITGFAFYFEGFLASMIFFRVATKWNDLLNLFKEVEDFCNTNTYTPPKCSLKKQIKLAALVMYAFALPEHLLSWYSFLNNLFHHANHCGLAIDSWFYYIMSNHLSSIYEVFPINIITILWAEYMNLCLAFAWNFVDLFIIIMSISIAAKFKMLNDRLNFLKGMVINGGFWDEIRRHYNKICELNEFVDALLGNLICIACLSDLYYICVQLLNMTTPRTRFPNKLYFWFSTLFLMGRTFSIFLIAASINDESTKPFKILRKIPRFGWCQEAKRLSHQIEHNVVALSGNNFFMLTRGILLSVIGTIITYELVLLQFGGAIIMMEKIDSCGNLKNNSLISDYQY